MAQCTAQRRYSAIRCKRHCAPGYTVCYFHGQGGGTGRGNLKDGRHAKTIRSGKVRDRYSAWAADPELLDLTHCVALAMAYYDEARELIDNTLESGGNLSFKQAEQLMLWTETISRLIERAHKLKFGDQHVFTLQESRILFAQVVDITGRNIDKRIDAETAGLLKADIANDMQELVGGTK